MATLLASQAYRAASGTFDRFSGTESLVPATAADKDGDDDDDDYGKDNEHNGGEPFTASVVVQQVTQSNVGGFTSISFRWGYEQKTSCIDRCLFPVPSAGDGIMVWKFRRGTAITRICLRVDDAIVAAQPNRSTVTEIGSQNHECYRGALATDKESVGREEFTNLSMDSDRLANAGQGVPERVSRTLSNSHQASWDSDRGVSKP